MPAPQISLGHISSIYTIIQYWRCIFFKIFFFGHLKLEIALVIPVLDDEYIDKKGIPPAPAKGNTLPIYVLVIQSRKLR